MWSEFREWVVPLLAVGSLLWQGFAMLRRNVVKHEDLARFATTENLLAVNKVLQDQVDEGGRELSNARHQIELLKKDVEALPTHSTVRDLREGVAELKEGQAISRTKLDGVTNDIGVLRESFNRLDDFLRTKP